MSHPGWLLCLALLALARSPTESIDVGFELHFETEPNVYRDLPVYFERPMPSWVSGHLVRNGLGRFEFGKKRRMKHAFDGYAKLSAWRFASPNATYFSSNFVATHFYRDSTQKGTIAPYLLFDEPIPSFSFFERMNALWRGIDNTNVNVVHYSGSTSTYVAVSDFWQSYSFDIDTLETKNYVNEPVPGGSPFGTSLPLPSSAHPLVEYGSTNQINFVSIMNPVPFFSSYVRLVRIKSARRRELIADIEVSEVPYMHSFALSQHYAAIFANPLYVNVMKMAKIANPSESLDWKPWMPMSVYLVELSSGKVREYKTGANFPVHFINAYEENNKLIADFVEYPDIEFIKSLKMDVVRDPVKRNTINPNSALVRYTLDLTSERITHQRFSPTPGLEFVNKLDMPAINENFRYHRYCYVYGLVLKADDYTLSKMALVKKDLCHPNSDKVWHQENHYPSEPWFLETPGAKAEDDGMIFSLVLDGEKKVSYLGVWDARNLQQINYSYLPTFIPYTLHGRFYPSPDHGVCSLL